MRFRLPRGISETNSQFFQIFLATGRLFAENLASKLWGIKGIAWRVAGGGVSFCVSLSTCAVRPCGACVRPCPPAKNRPSVGLELGFVRPSLWPFPWGFYYIACLRTLSSGEQRAKIFIPFACPVLSTKEDDNRRNACNHLSVQKNTAFVGSCLCVLFLLFSIETLQAVYLSLHRYVFLLPSCRLQCVLPWGLKYNINRFCRGPRCGTCTKKRLLC